jgi:Ca2+/Na+ antiporter
MGLALISGGMIILLGIVAGIVLVINPRQDGRRDSTVDRQK